MNRKGKLQKLINEAKAVVKMKKIVSQLERNYKNKLAKKEAQDRKTDVLSAETLINKI